MTIPPTQLAWQMIALAVLLCAFWGIIFSGDGDE